MSLFKNGVGRPSNDTLKKRKIIYSVVAVVILLLIAGGTYFIINGFGFSKIESNNKNSTTSNFFGNYNYIGTKNKISIGVNELKVSISDKLEVFYNYSTLKLSSKYKNIYGKRIVYKNGKVYKNSGCYLAKGELGDLMSDNFSVSENNSYYVIYAMYSNKTCSNKLVSVKSNVLKVGTVNPIAYSISEDYNSVQYMVGPKKSNTVYSRVEVYANDEKVKTSKCSKVKYNTWLSYDDFSLKNPLAVQYKINIYNDAKCTRQISSKTSELLTNGEYLPEAQMISGITTENDELFVNDAGEKYPVTWNKGKSNKIYYYSASVGNSFIDAIDSKKITTCKKVNVNDKIYSLSVDSKQPTKALYYEIYSDKKCKNKLSYGTVELIYDNTKPIITNVCKKDNYVYITAEDDNYLGYAAWVKVGQSCSKLPSYEYKVLKDYKYNSLKISNKRINTKLPIKVCLKDAAGNLSEKKVFSKCS